MSFVNKTCLDFPLDYLNVNREPSGTIVWRVDAVHTPVMRIDILKKIVLKESNSIVH